MMAKHTLLYSFFIAVFSFAGCKQKYEPPVIKTDLRYLVVDGSLINGTDSTIIRLSRTGKLNSVTALSGEINAQMSVEDADGNTVYNFLPTDNKGEYAVPGMSLDVNKKYKLRINTTDGNQYVSDDISLKETPPIDSVSWLLSGAGVNIYVNTHDPQNATKYYRWDYVETWEYYTNYYSQIKYQIAGTIDSMFPERTPEELIFHCWKTQNSNEIFTASSTRLSEDVISLKPLRFIPVNSFEISTQYSILVKQYALTKEAFEYLENIKKISEQTGSLFDAQPSQLNSNIHCIGKPNEPVIGFITASSLQQQRIFITKQAVEPWNYFYPCPPKQKIPLIIDSLNYYFGGAVPMLTPTEEVFDPRFTGVNGAIPICADCLTNKGINVKPAYWP